MSDAMTAVSASDVIAYIDFTQPPKRTTATFARATMEIGETGVPKPSIPALAEVKTGSSDQRFTDCEQAAGRVR
jgi:hypothetical protein